MACWNTYLKKTDDNSVVVYSGDRKNSYFGKFWVARIIGKDDKYGLKREFINGLRDEKILSDGVYEVFRTCQWAKNPERYFLIIENGQYEKTFSATEIISKLSSSNGSEQ